MSEYIEKAITALQSAGIAARRGFLAGKMPYLTAPLATVSLERLTEDTLTLCVWIYAPVLKGGTICEDTAVFAAEKLSALGGQCQLGSCSFEGKSCVFSIPVLATFAKTVEPAVQIVQPQVEIAGVPVVNVVDVSTAFTCTPVKGKNETTGAVGMNAGEKRWMVTVEDLMSYSRPSQQEITDGFTVVISRSGERETYNGCCWSKVTTTATAEGIRRIRVAITCNDPVISAV